MTCLLLALLAILLAASAPAASLYEQSIAAVLERRFPGDGISYLVLDARTGELVASRWADPNHPVPMGSLVKPFTALAYGGAHHFRFPEFTCAGKSSGCWLPQGHGRVSLPQAVAYSCNAYFRFLATGLKAEDVSSWAQRFGIRGPESDAPGALIGLEGGWRVAPLSMTLAYSELVARATEPGVEELLRGMALAARVGTGRALGSALPNATVLVKTGTAPCTHEHRAPGDGYVLAFYPLGTGRYALLVRVHGVPGMQAAAVAGRMLHALREGQ